MNRILILIINAILLTGVWSSCSEVITYPAPEGEPASEDFSVKVNGKEVFVYQARVSAMPVNMHYPGYQRPIEQTELASFCYFDMKGSVTVEIESKKAIDNLVIRPLSKKIRPDNDKHKIKFELKNPGQLVIEVNDRHGALHLFANEPEKEKINPEDKDVVYFGPGVHYPGIIELKDNQTVYVAGGAIVHALLEGTHAKNIKIKGRGILDASTIDRNMEQEKAGRWDIISFYYCEQISVEGIILRDPFHWTFVIWETNNVVIDNVKLIGLWRYGADGIDLVNASNVKISNSFVRSFDDAIAIKGFKCNQAGGNSTDIHVNRCVLWNDWGRALEIGAETCADSISRCRFEDTDIVHYVHVALDIQNGDRAYVKDIVYDNIRIEEPIRDNYTFDDSANPIKDVKDIPKIPGNHPDALGRLVVMWVLVTGYSHDHQRGYISDVHFRNIQFLSDAKQYSYIKGLTPENLVTDCSFDISLNGRKMTKDDIEFNEFTENMIFIK